MKLETSKHGLRITGKAWEIRTKLKQLSSDQKLQEWLETGVHHPPKLRVLPGGMKKRSRKKGR